MDNRAIGIFDSGVGGLTVYKEIKKIMPNEKYIYIGDTQRFPYGNKSKENIIEISKNIVECLISFNVKLIVIACGTATSQAIQELKRIYRVPIIGIIEPTIKNKIDENTKRIGIIGTRGTIRSKAWEEKILEKAIERFILTGRNDTYTIDVIIYGVVNDFIWITKEEIKSIILKQKSIPSSAVHFGPLFIQPLARCLNHNPTYEYGRYCIQLKWYNLADDIIKVMMERWENHMNNIIHTSIRKEG